MRDKVNHELETLSHDNGLLLRDFSAVSKFKSIARAIRRGLVAEDGTIYPKRPFNNRKRGRGTQTYERRRVYEWLKAYKGGV